MSSKCNPGPAPLRISFTNILFKDTLSKDRVTLAKLVLGAVAGVLALDVVVPDLAGPLVGGGVAS